MIWSHDLNELATALATAQGEFEAVAKTADNPFFKSRYADLPSVVKAASPILSKLGLSVVQTLGADTVSTVLLHKSGQYIGDTAHLHLGKLDSQGLGSAVTYARRYAYMAILGLVADVDDDANAASATPTQSHTIRREPPRTPVAASKPAESVVAGPAGSMDLRTVTAALEAAGLPTTGSLAEKRARLSTEATTAPTTTYAQDEEPF